MELKYIELKTEGHSGPAWIARVQHSRSRTTVYFNGKALKKSGGQGIYGNHYDLQSGEEYWISGVKKDGLDRHKHGSGKTMIERSVVPGYLEITSFKKLPKHLEVIDDLPPTNIERLTQMENTKLDS